MDIFYTVRLVFWNVQNDLLHTDEENPNFAEQGVAAIMPNRLMPRTSISPDCLITGTVHQSRGSTELLHQSVRCPWRKPTHTSLFR